MAGELAAAYVSLVPSFRGGSAQISSALGGPAATAGRTAGATAGTSFTHAFATNLQGAGQRLTGIGTSLTTGVTLPMVAAAGATFAFSKDFNKSMSNVATLMPGSTDRVLELKAGVQDLAVEMGKGTGDMADGLYNVVSAFGDTSDTMGVLEINAKAATAGMAATTDAIDLTSAVTKGYGDTSAAAVQHAADLALLTVRMGQTTFPELATSIGSVVPMANELGVSQEELFATMATFTGVTGGASEVSTQLRSALKALMAPTTSGAEAIAEAGFASGKAAIEALGMEGAIGLLTDAATDSGEPLQQYIGDIEGQTIALGLAGSQADDYSTKLGEMSTAAGANDEAFAEVTDGVNAAGFGFDQAKTKALIMAQDLGDALTPAIVSVINAATPLIGLVSRLAAWFSDLPPGVQTTALTMGLLVAALGPTLIIVGKIITAVGTMIKVGQGLVIVIRAIGIAIATNPLGLLLTGVALLITGLILAWQNSETFRDIVTGALSAIGDFFMWVWEKGIKPFWDALLWGFNWAKANWPTILTILTGPIGIAVRLIIKHWDKIKAVFKVVMNFARRIVSERIAAVRSTIDKLGEIPGKIKGWFSRGYQSAKDQLNKLINFAKNLPGKIKDKLSSLPDKLKAPFRTAFNGVANLWNNTLGSWSVSIPDWAPGIGGKSWSMPKIPLMASGGIVTRATLAMIGEGRESEAVLPLSKLDAMLEHASGARQTVAAAPTPIELVAGDRHLLAWLQGVVRTRYGGNVQRALTGGRG